MKALLILSASVSLAIAADHPSAGTWKLNVSASTVKDCSADALRTKTLEVPTDISMQSRTPRKDAVAHPVVMHFESINEKTLVATPASGGACRLVYEKQ